MLGWLAVAAVLSLSAAELPACGGPVLYEFESQSKDRKDDWAAFETAHSRLLAAAARDHEYKVPTELVRRNGEGELPISRSWNHSEDRAARVEVFDAGARIAVPDDAAMVLAHELGHL